jgi:capsular polysaccharide biosynthesis protein
MFEVFDTKDRNLIIIICIIIIIIYIFRTIHPAYNGDLQILMNDLSTTLVESLVGSPIDENDWKHSTVKFLMMKR